MFLRTAEETSRRPAVPKTGGFHSASTISVQPARLFVGLIPEVSLGPRVRVSRACAPSYMPFARNVSSTAASTSIRVGCPLKASAFAESKSRSRCASSAKIRPL